jgi:FO synthase
MEGLIDFCKAHMPSVSLQVPPNVEPHWEKFIALGVNDLGGMGSGGDLVNPRSPWPEMSLVVKKMTEVGGILEKRLPIYPRFYRQGWYSKRVGKVLSEWIEGNDEYKYYSQGSVEGQGTLS